MAAGLKRGLAMLGRGVGAVLIALVRVYQWAISPWLGPCCRFEPTCSGYAITAIRRFGPVHGLGLALGRFARCHPWGSSGYDPVPEDLGKDRPET